MSYRQEACGKYPKGLVAFAHAGPRPSPPPFTFAGTYIWSRSITGYLDRKTHGLGWIKLVPVDDVSTS